MKDGDGPSGLEKEEKGKAKKKDSGGYRCMVMHCSSTYATTTVHTMPGPMPRPGGTGRFSSYQMAWINFIKRHRVFDHSWLRHIHVCSLHFDQSQYDQTQLKMFELGLRKLPPKLLANAIPHIYNPTADPASGSGHGHRDGTLLHVSPKVRSNFSTSTLASPSCPSANVVPSASSSLDDQDPDRSSTFVGLEHEHDGEDYSHSQTPVSAVSAPLEPVAGTATSPTSQDVRRKRQRTSYSRKKEVVEITEEYTRKDDEERASARTKDILGRSKGFQCSVKMVHRRVGIRKQRRTCKVQVKPITVSKGKQVNFPKERAADLCDAVTQTEGIFVLKAANQHVEKEAVDDVEDEATDDEPADDEPVDDETKDPTYIPGEETNSPRKEGQSRSEPKSPLMQEKFIVFESNLMELFEVCISCLSKNVHVEKVSSQSLGSALKVVTTCLDCGLRREWLSQPKVGDIYAGNMLLSGAILFGGSSPTKVLRVLRHMNVKAITVETFMKHQREYLQPAVIRVAKKEQRKLINEIPEGEPLILGGDGQSDSPGHCAKYGSYTLMDLKRNKILDVQLVQSNEVRNSNAMELEGLARGLTSLKEKGVNIRMLVTDRHLQVAKWLRENYPDINHRYDVWHIAKGLKKKIIAVSKLKDCEVVGRWKRSINNHVYWCASSTPDGDGEVMVAKFKSILNHMRNIHENHSDVYPACSHGENHGQREWMRQGTKPFEKLSEELSKTRLLNDMKKMSPVDQTSSVEAFHSVMLYWCPKMLAYSYAGMKCRLHLAALHWNENAGRSHATKADGTPMYRINYPKAKEGGHTVSKALTACTFNYVRTLMEETMQLVSGKQKIRSTIPELEGKPPLCSGVDRPSKAEAIDQLQVHRRFSKE
ncbi:uncharacterized protein LOC129282034 [Lytechinus pictus]|uniref:uncharacterized protein LOC129282034 n=1 Tax=Lytechinus pictus TaxID=7653 RepID=UPI0030B9C9D1